MIVIVSVKPAVSLLIGHPLCGTDMSGQKGCFLLQAADKLCNRNRHLLPAYFMDACIGIAR